jgi:hypothetical protein
MTPFAMQRQCGPILGQSTVGASENCFHKLVRGKIGVSFNVLNDASPCDVDHASPGDKDVFLLPTGTWIRRTGKKQTNRILLREKRTANKSTEFAPPSPSVWKSQNL